MPLRQALQRLGVCRRQVWDRRTLVDILLDSPLTYFGTLLYYLFVFLRGRPCRPPADKPPIRVVCISDTHDHTLPVPDGDLLIHAGDLTSAGSCADIQRQIDWLDALPHRHKVVVCGNHDNYFDARSRSQEDRDAKALLDFKSVRYLQRTSAALDFPGRRPLKVYGAPDIPKCGNNFAFQYPTSKGGRPWDRMVPLQTDILVTHTPPFGHLDLDLGCQSLLLEAWRVRPRLHVFGHIHWGYGREAVYWDECQRAYERLRARPPQSLVWDMLPNSRWADVAQIVYHGVLGVVWRWAMIGPWENTGTMMVNAAQMVGDSGKMGNGPQVVEI